MNDSTNIPATLNYTALDATPTTDDIKNFFTAFPASKMSVWPLLIAIVLWAITLFALVTMIITGTGSSFLVLLVAAGIFAAIMTLRVFLAKRHNLTDAKVYAFCRQNDLGFIPTRMNLGYAGMLFNHGRDRIAQTQIMRISEPAFEISNYQYTIGSSRYKRTIYMGYIKVQLKNALPNIVLDSKLNNTNVFGHSISNLPDSLNKSQILQLEGDFNNHFTLYVPRGYERDALYIFTPELMALFIDEAGSYDAEIVDNNLFIYSAAPFKYTASEITRHMAIIAQVGSETVENTVRYRDERVTDSSGVTVAKSGQRLRQNFRWSVFIIAILYVLYLIGDVLHIPGFH